MSLNYGFKVRGELDKLLDTDVIFPTKTAQWISLLVIIAKKNGQALNTCKLWKAKCSNEERPISFAISGFSP